MRAIAAAVAVWAANEDIAEELHLDLLEARAAAAPTLTLSGIETEGASVQPALPGDIGLGEELADVIERADIDGRI